MLRNRRVRRVATAAAGVGLVLTIAACGNIETAPDERAVRYSGGAVFPEDQQFKNCQAPGTQKFGSAGDTGYNYPVGQRTFKFSGDPGADATPLKVSAPSPGGGQPIEMDVSGTVTFTPNFGDCKLLQAFHENVGIKYQAWTPEGWGELIGLYIKDPTDRSLDNEALKFDWVKLSSNVDSKAAWETAVAKSIPAQIERQMGGKYFTINSVTLQKPDLPGNVKSAIADTEAARQQAATADQVKQAAATFPGGPAAYQEFLRQQSVNKAIESGQVRVLPIPQGSDIIVNPGG